MRRVLATIGYEDTTLENVVATLKAAGITTLIDVRAVPLSRKPGFSKNKLANRLGEDGIAYAGIRSLGTPAAGRDAARKGRITEMRAIFEEHLTTEAAIAGMAEAINVASNSRACLLCFERDHTTCHRAIVAQHMDNVARFEIQHLDPALGEFL